MHALEFVIELGKIESLTTEIVLKLSKVPPSLHRQRLEKRASCGDQDRACKPQVIGDGDRNLCFSIVIRDSSRSHLVVGRRDLTKMPSI